jgi:phosphate transport system protein
LTAQAIEPGLQHLEEEVMVLGGVVESMLLEAVDLLKRCDLNGLERLGDAERQIRQKRLAIEMGCLQFIVNQCPQGAGLRHAVALIEIAAELERIGEHAQKVARGNCLTVEHQLRKPMANIHRLGAGVQSIVDQVLEALARRDVIAVRSVLVDVQAADDQYRQVNKDLLVIMNSRPRVANQAVYLSRAAYNLKRAAERVTGICEWILFSLVGSMEGAQPGLSDQGPATDLAQQPAKVL